MALGANDIVFRLPCSARDHIRGRRDSFGPGLNGWPSGRTQGREEPLLVVVLRGLVMAWKKARDTIA